MYIAKPNRKILGFALSKAKTDLLGAAEVIIENCCLHDSAGLKDDNGFKLGVVGQLDAIFETQTIELKKI